VSGFPHQRHTAACLDPWGEVTRGFHVIDDGGASFAFENVLRKQQQLAIRVNDMALLGDHTQAVAIAIKGETEFGLAIS